MKRIHLFLVFFASVIVFLSPCIFAGNIEYAKTLYDQANYTRALPEFQTVFAESSGETRMDAFLHLPEMDPGI